MWSVGGFVSISRVKGDLQSGLAPENKIPGMGESELVPSNRKNGGRNCVV